ncbi:unnamed protein product [Mucor hiemalis]
MADDHMEGEQINDQQQPQQPQAAGNKQFARPKNNNFEQQPVMNMGMMNPLQYQQFQQMMMMQQFQRQQMQRQSAMAAAAAAAAANNNNSNISSRNPKTACRLPMF